MDLDRLRNECRGKWVNIFNQFGIEFEIKKNQPCVICGGTDRFWYDGKNDRGAYFCRQCGPGDGFDLICKTLGIEFKDCIKKIGEVVGMVDNDPKNDKPPIDAKNALNELWKKSQPLSGSDPVVKYLHSRKINLTPNNVRYCPKCYESDSKEEIPAMISMIHNKNGTPISLHRTYLEKGIKKMMPGIEHLGGSAIRLINPGEMGTDVHALGVAEGIETALSAAQLYFVATWACMSTSILETFEPPKKYREIVIFGDNDPNFAGQKAAYTLAKRLYSQGLIVNVEIPKGHNDFNDELVNGMLREVNKCHTTTK